MGKTAYLIQEDRTTPTGTVRAVIGFADDKPTAEAYIAARRRDDAPSPLVILAYSVLEVPHVAPPPVMVRCCYTCKVCDPDRMHFVNVPLPSDDMGYWEWGQGVALPTMIARHEQRSPNCKPLSLEVWFSPPFLPLGDSTTWPVPPQIPARPEPTPPPPAMIEMFYTCPSCSPGDRQDDKRSVMVPQSQGELSPSAWANDVAMPTLIADHERRHPTCRSQTLDVSFGAMGVRP